MAYSTFRLLAPLLVVVMLVVMAEATPPGIAKNPSHATCKIKKYKHCYNLEHVCPKFCPDQCYVECASCKPICGSGDANPPPDDTPTPATPSPPSPSPDTPTPSPPVSNPTPPPTPVTPSPSPPPPVAVTPSPPASNPTPPYSPPLPSPTPVTPSPSPPPPVAVTPSPPASNPTPPYSPPLPSPTPATPSPSPPPPVAVTPSPPASNPTPPYSPPLPSPTPVTPSPSPPPPVAVTPSPPASNPTPPYSPPLPSPTPVTPSPSPPNPSSPPPPSTGPPSTPPVNHPPSPPPPTNTNPPSTPPANPNPPTPSTPNSPSPTPPSETPNSPPINSPPAAPQTPSSPASPPSTPTPPSSLDDGEKRVRCKNVNYPQCYNMIHTCPSACPNGCEVDCVTCKPVCHCDRPGAVCQDPRFVGGDGITFYFHGKKDRDFCLVSDPNLHINAHFIGKRNPSLNRDFTWVQSLAILFHNHRLFIAAQKTNVWDDSIDRLTIAFDDHLVALPTSEGSRLHHPTENPTIVIVRLAATNHMMVEAKGLFRITAKVVPITKKESRIHNYGIEEGDTFAHLDVGFKFFGLSKEVSGILGQTYGAGYVSGVNVKAAMALMGRAEEFETSSLFAADCAVSRFGGGVSGGDESI